MDRKRKDSKITSKDKLRFVGRFLVRYHKGRWECICTTYASHKFCEHVIDAMWDDTLENERKN